MLLALCQLRYQQPNGFQWRRTSVEAQIVVVIHFRGDVPATYLGIKSVALIVSHPTAAKEFSIGEFLPRIVGGHEKPDAVIKV